MTKVVIYGPMSLEPWYHVHADGCADTKKRQYTRDPYMGWPVEASSHRDVVMDVYGDVMTDSHTDEEIAGDEVWREYADDVKVFPCVHWEDEA